jgi:PBP1b-binding outer membrane lipoprotein LpoB
MKKVKTLVLVAGLALLLSGCAVVGAPVMGVVYTDVKGPVTATSNTGSTKVGVSEATSILGIIATGDASIETAAKSAGITKIHHVDQESMNILGIFAKYKLFVYGE